MLTEDDSTLLVDSSNDVFFSIGEASVGGVDFVGGNLSVVGDDLFLGFSTKEALPVLGFDEFVEFEGLLFLWDDEEVVGSFEFLVVVNSSGFVGTLVDLDSLDEVDLEVSLDDNSWLVVVDVSKVGEFGVLEWSLSSTYEVFSGDEVVVFASDFAPDEDMHTTFLDEENL